MWIGLDGSILWKTSFLENFLFSIVATIEEANESLNQQLNHLFFIILLSIVLRTQIHLCDGNFTNHNFHMLGIQHDNFTIKNMFLNWFF